MGLLSLQKQLVRRLKDNAFMRVRPSTRGSLDTYRASFYRTSKRIYQEKAEGFAKKVRIHMALDMSGSMSDSQLQSGWEAMRCVRDTFRSVAETDIYFWDDCVYHCTEDILESIRRRPAWDNHIQTFLEKELQGPYKRIVSNEGTKVDLLKGMSSIKQMLYRQRGEGVYWYGPAYDGYTDEELIEKTRVVLGTKTTELACRKVRKYGSTDDIVALTEIFSQCASAPTERHIIFFFTDGSPNYDSGKGESIHNGLRTPCVEDRRKWIRRNCTAQGRDVTFIPIGIDHNVQNTYGTGTSFSSKHGTEGFLRAMLKHLQYLPIFSS